MDIRKKLLLQRHRDAIVKDLEIVDIIDELVTKDVVPIEEVERMLKLTSRVEKTKQLLDFVENSNDNAFQAFIDCLKKDYSWLWKLLSTDNILDMLNSSFEDSLSKGDVPRLPNHYVRRTLVERDVASQLENLQRHKAVVLLGTLGSGKTAIATSVLRNNPDIINNKFSGQVFWLNCSNCRTEHDITYLQSKLHRKTSMWSSSYNMNSSISISSISSVGDTTISGYERTWESMKDMLKVHFSKQSLCDALLVLDEVNEKGCVEAFDIGCKTLITTRDKDVFSDIDAHVIEIKNSFDDREILELFANCLGISVNELPRHAKKLQEACKGKSPFHLALIGAQLAENRESLIDVGSQLWKHYINNIEKRTFFSIFNHEKSEKSEKVMKFCLDSLENGILSLFKMLAILPDNVRVSAEVLSKLWRKNVREVESILRKLKNKSLINEWYDKDQKSYLYETHEIILDYLKTCSTEEERNKLHSEFLKSYHYDNPSSTTVEIVDDGYIAYYIGYHLGNSYNEDNKLNMFHRLFLDLKFLGNKVRLTGPADVIYDLQKYERYIVKDQLDRELLTTIVAFLKTYGTDLYRYPCTDIVQSVLQHESKGILYKKAYEVAQANCAKNELYFDFSHEHNVEEIIPSTIDVKETITSCCFQFDCVLIGTELGKVKIFHLHSNKLREEMHVTNHPIKWIGACPVKPFKVAILTKDGDINLWNIKEEDTNTIEEECEDQPSSLHSSIPVNPTIRPCLNAKWATEDAILVSHTYRTIFLNNTEGQVLQRIDTDVHEKILCCTLFNDRFTIAAVCNNSANNLVLYDCCNITQKKIMTVEETDTVQDLIVVPGTYKVITLKEREITQHKFNINSYSYQNKYICKSEKVIANDDIKENISFLSIAVNKSGSLLFVSTCDRRVLCIDLNTNSRAFDIENRRGNVVSMDVSEILAEDDILPGMDVLLTGTGTVENSAKVWFLDASFVSQKRQQIDNVRLTKTFDVSFTNTLSPHTPTASPTESITNSNANTPKRHQSFAERTEPPKKPALKTLSLDRYSLKPLNLKGACNNNDGVQPLLAVVDDTNNIQVMRGRKLLTKILTNVDDQVNIVKISPCNQYIVYGMRSGHVNKFTVRSKDTKLIMDLSSPINYLNFVNPNLLIVAGENRCLMAYQMGTDGNWKSKMLQRGSCHLGSQEMLNDIQGVKKKNGHSDNFSDSGSTIFLSDSSTLVDCFWIMDAGLITVEYNAAVKLWDLHLNLKSVLNAMLSRRESVRATCAACRKKILVICDGANMKYQVFQISKEDEYLRLNLKLNQTVSSGIVSCDLTSDGNKLALGLESGLIELWNINQRSCIAVLRHHKSEVSWCSFSPVPEKLYRNTPLHSPTAYHTQPPTFDVTQDEGPPLVLVSMAAEILWWDISYVIKQRGNSWIRNTNTLSPLLSPVENRSEVSINNNSVAQNNVFFGNGSIVSHDCWKYIWKYKKCKEGSKRKDILACIKLSGMNAKQLRHNEEFSCFVTVDNSGHVHIMNVMKPNT